MKNLKYIKKQVLSKVPSYSKITAFLGLFRNFLKVSYILIISVHKHVLHKHVLRLLIMFYLSILMPQIISSSLLKLYHLLSMTGQSLFSPITSIKDILVILTNILFKINF